MAVWNDADQQGASNGAVMRTSVLGIYQFENMEHVIKNTVELCTVTHADYRFVRINNL